KPSQGTPTPLIHCQPPSFLLQSSEYPHLLNKGLIFKVFYKRIKYWIHPLEYRGLTSDGSIIAGGHIYELKKKPTVSRELRDLDFELLQLKYPDIKWVPLSYMSHRVDFLLDDDKRLFSD